jgi:DUF4097 and DUF4098 domain-containing protein YvlB
MKIRQRAAWILTIALILSTGCGLAVDKVVEKRFDVRSGGTFALDADRGSMRITRGADDQVLVRIKLRARTSSESKAEDIFDDFDMRFEEHDGGVTVETEYRGGSKGWFGWGDDKLNIHFEVEVPARYNLRVKTSGGSIEVDDLDGDIEARTSGGSLSFGRIGGTLHGRTSGGSIRLDDCRGPVDVETSGGSITVGRVSGEVRAHTSGGSITVKEVMGPIDASTSGGSVTATLTEQPAADCRLRTSGGSITVRVPSDARLSLNARTSGGKVYSEFHRGVKPEKSLKADINGGGPELYLKTSGGSIYIKTD